MAVALCSCDGVLFKSLDGGKYGPSSKIQQVHIIQEILKRFIIKVRHSLENSWQ